ncbi:MAG TPA: twin-arginine translocation signal domain-containing protein, partial [Caldilinea sp.]|nr:twin-arginine translocation signal domain-containing protein [Caldilinea sp.]
MTDHAKANSLSRRQFLRLTGMAAGAVALAACAPSAAPAGQDAAGDAGEAAAGQVTISWWNGYSTPTVQEVAPKIISDFEAMHPNIKIEYEITGGPPGGGNMTEVMLSRIAAGNPPDTVTLFDSPAQYGALGALTAIDDLMGGAQLAKPDAFYEGVLNTCKWQGSTYGLPASAAASAMFYNTDKFAEKGIAMTRENFPTTWDELRALSDQFTVLENGEIVQAGYMPPWAATWLYPVWSALNGSQIFDAANTVYTVNSAENVGWVDYWAKWLDESYGGDFEKINIAAGNWADAYPPSSAFTNEMSAMLVDGGWIMTDVEMPFQWEIAKLPYGPSGTKTASGFWPNWFAMPKGGAAPAEAFLFIEYFCTQGWETWYRSIPDTPAWKGASRDVVTQGLIDKFGEERALDLHRFFLDYLADAAPMWNSPINNFASDTLAAAITEVLGKVKGAQEAMDEAQALIQARLEET